ncbi:MAG: ANTAR domain-containing protein [Streptomyces sp.]|nr:ANTAR domain-containing protein [Streptomyces sp.]NUT29168.1 ANTAR domain-containing protein [Streptomyces sp.]
MISDGMAEVLRSLGRGPGDEVMRASAELLAADGVAVVLVVCNDQLAEPLWWTPGASARFEELQYTLGEGPGPEAIRTRTHVLEPDLEAVRPGRWPALVPAARRAGVHGVCCYFLGVGGIRLGVLTVLSSPDRKLTEQHHDDSLALAAGLTTALLYGNPPGAWPGDGEVTQERTMWASGGLHRPVVHQATGMISVQLDVSLAEALVRLRAHAYASGRPLGEVAQDVVARKLRFGNDVNGPYPADGGKG